MHLLLALTLLGCAASQLILPGLPDRIHDFTFEIHRQHNHLLVHNRTACYLVDITSDMKASLLHHDDRIKMEDAIYAQIQANTGVTKVDSSVLSSTYHDLLARLECRKHGVYKVAYTAPAGTL